jgi:membrane protein DedA with SNARE-associated domain
VTFSLVGTLVELVITILTTIGLTGLFLLMVVESFGVPPLPSEVILPFAGFLIATGTFLFFPTLIVALAGSLVGAFIAYSVGRWGRPYLTRLRLGPVRLEERHLNRMDRWFSQHGEVTVAIARCIPVVRAYISYPAGTARMPPARFGAYTLLGSLPFTLGLLYAGIVLGKRWRDVERYLTPLDWIVYGVLIAGALYLGVLYVRARRAATARPPLPSPDTVPRPPPGSAPPVP